MTEINPVLIEKYQLMLQNDPRARVFAPLAEAYRKMGLIDEAIQICVQGLQFNPDFASGRVALGRLYLEKGQYPEAVDQLKKAVDLSPENLLAQSLLGDACLRIRRPKEALQAYKMLLFLNPTDKKAQEAVRKLESLTADEYDEDVFALSKLGATADQLENLEVEAEPIKPLAGDEHERRRRRDLDRFVSLADAYLVRNDFDRALATLENAERLHGPDPDIIKRLKLIRMRTDEESAVTSHTPRPTDRKSQAKEKQIDLLKGLLERVARSRRKA